MNRVELHLYTKLSDDISVIETNEELRYIVMHSHRAIAFINLNNVQDFSVMTVLGVFRSRANLSETLLT